MKPSLSLNHGFTLLELLLVVFLLGVIAMTSFAVVQDSDDQQRYDATKTYYQLIKKAIIGEPYSPLNSDPSLSGFVADMGRLPRCLRELVERTGCDASSVSDDLPSWAQDADTLVWSGWRGPYLQGLPESGGLAFRDGWGNQGAATANGANNPDAVNYGWLFGAGAANATACSAANVAQMQPGWLLVQSCGSNGQVDLTPNGSYADDYPVMVNGQQLPMLVEADYQNGLGLDWQTVQVELVNDAGIALEVAADSLRLSVNYPINGSLPICPVAGGVGCPAGAAFAPFLSNPFPELGLNSSGSGTRLSVGAGQTLVFPAGSSYAAPTLSVFQTGAVSFSAGSQLVLSGCQATAPCQVTVTGNATFDPGSHTLTANAALTLDVPPANVASVQFAVTGLLKPYVDVPAGSSLDGQTITLPDATSLTLNNAVVLTQGPAGPRAILNVTSSPATLTADADLLAIGPRISVTNSTDRFVVPPGSQLTSARQITLAEGLALPMGRQSLTIVCDARDNAAGDYRKLFDGDCAASPTGVTATPIALQVAPRTTLVAPAPLRWHLR